MVSGIGVMNPKAQIVDAFPQEIREIEHAWIPLADGTRLAARLWLPVDAEGLSAYFATCPQRKKAKAAQPSESRKTHKDLGDASDAEVISSDDSDKTSPPPPARKPPRFQPTGRPIGRSPEIRLPALCSP